MREQLRDALRVELAETGEWLAQFDYGPPHRATDAASRSFDVMYRTGPRQAAETGPSLEREPPQLDA